MTARFQFARSRIKLPTAVLDQLREMTPAAWKVNTFLSSRHVGQPIPAAVSTIKVGTGLGARSIIGALKLLRENGLIIHHPGKGNQPNSHSLPDVPPMAGRPAPAKPTGWRSIRGCDSDGDAFGCATLEMFGWLVNRSPEHFIWASS